MKVDDFQDFGQVEWFNIEKGFGIVNSIRNNSIFIHKSEVSGFALKGKYVLIGIVKYNTNQCRNDGKNVKIWEGSFLEFCELILKSNKKNQYNNDIKWLITNGNDIILKQIIESNFNNWVKNQNFIEQIKILKSRTFKFWDDNDIKKRAIINDFIFKLWLLNDGVSFDEDIKSLINKENKDLVEKIIQANKENWFKNEEFIDKIREVDVDIFQKFLIDYCIFYKGSKFDKNIRWSMINGDDKILKQIIDSGYLNWFKNQEFIEQIKSLRIKGIGSISNKIIYTPKSHIVCSFILDLWKFNGGTEFDDSLKWLIKNANDEIVYEIIEENKFSWFTNQLFIDYVRNIEKDSVYKFILDLWMFQGGVECDENAKWLIKNSNEEIIIKLIKENWKNWIKSKEFIFHLIKSYRISSYNPIYVEFLKNAWTYQLELWKSSKYLEYNYDLAWLLDNCNNFSIQKSIIELNKDNWLANYEFIEHIKKLYTLKRECKDLYFKFLNEVCNFSIGEMCYQNILWLLENEGIDFNEIKHLIIKKLAYKNDNLEKIFSALFPENDLLYYKKRTYNKGWSSRFKDEYILENYNKKLTQFLNLFEIEFKFGSNLLTNKVNIKRETHAATDLANFAFCPASYIIGQTYKIDIPEQENIFIGKQEHQKQRLLNFTQTQKQSEDKTINPLFSRVYNAKCISQGHSESTPIIYSSKNKKLCGIPDYIFKDSKGYFAVEEKYTFYKNDESIKDKVLYLNHKIQALTYLYGLSDFQFEEVYVIYWFISDQDNNEYHISNYRIFKLIRSNENKELILKMYNNIENIQDRKPAPLQINYNKCVQCNYFPYCKYKKTGIDVVQLPPLS